MANTDASPPPTVAFTLDASVEPYNVSAQTYLDAHPEFDGIATGAVVFHTDAAGGDRVLLVKRAAHDSMPGRWEGPGGACDLEDETIPHGLARELWEESGLVAEHVLARVGGEHVFHTRDGRRVSKLNFVVRVRTEAPGVAPTVTLDPNEHSAFVWATEEECRAGRTGDQVELRFTTKEQEKTIYEGFEARKAGKAGV